MSKVINAKILRRDLGKIVESVRKGASFTVLYRSRPAFEIVPVDAVDLDLGDPQEDPLYGAPAVGRSNDGRSAADHDALLYGARRG
ncbi:MAG: hypothetical protein EXR91_06590 [Gemmatimonadetes bacterium]|nr:hypothetical protein [Gemmatimonadota bacterium]